MHAIRINRKDSKALTGVGEIAGKPVMLAKPQTFMNLSGTSVKPLMEKHGFTPADLIVVWDELNLPWGGLKILASGSAGGHNGADSVIRGVGTQEFVRVRLGVHPGHPLSSGMDYLLAPVKRSQTKEMEELVGRGADAVVSIIAEGAAKAMTKFNRRAQGSNEEE
jgi:PTH1 family peptidyl-tRNA hydrolase